MTRAACVLIMVWMCPVCPEEREGTSCDACGGKRYGVEGLGLGCARGAWRGGFGVARAPARSFGAGSVFLFCVHKSNLRTVKYKRNAARGETAIQEV